MHRSLFQVAVGTASAITWVGAASAAQPSRVVVAWEAPAGCPTQEILQSEIEELLGRPLASPENASLSARGEVTRGGQGYRLRLSIDDTDGAKARSLEDPSCERLARAAAQILELAIEESSLAQASAPPVEVAPLPAPAPRSEPGALAGNPPTDSSGERPPSVPSPRTMHVLAGLGAGLDGGSLPKPAPGVSVSVAAERGRMRLRGSFDYWASERETVEGSAGGDFWIAAGDLRGCYALLRVPVRLGPCASFEAGTMVAHGVGVLHPGSGSALWLASSAAVEAAYTLAKGLAVVTSVDATFPFGQREFFLENVGNVYRPPVVTGRLAVGLEVEVW